MTAPPAMNVPPPPPHPPAVPAAPVVPPAPDTAGTPEQAAPTAAPGDTGEERSTLAALLAPVQPARPVLGSTADLAGDDRDDEHGASPGKDGKNAADAAAAAGAGEGPVAALIRAVAARLARTGTATTVKRQHTVSENRVTGNSSNTTSTNKTDRLAKNDQSGHHRSQRDAKVADLNTKNQQHQGRNHQDVKRSQDRKDHGNRDQRRTDASDTRNGDTRASKQDNGSKSSRDHRSSTDSKNSDTSRNDNGSKPGAENRGPNRSQGGSGTTGGGSETRGGGSGDGSRGPARDHGGTRTTNGRGPGASGAGATKEPGPATNGGGSETRSDGPETTPRGSERADRGRGPQAAEPGAGDPGPAALTETGGDKPSWLKKVKDYVAGPFRKEKRKDEPVNTVPAPADPTPGDIDDKGLDTKWGQATPRDEKNAGIPAQPGDTATGTPVPEPGPSGAGTSADKAGTKASTLLKNDAEQDGTASRERPVATSRETGNNAPATPPAEDGPLPTGSERSTASVKTQDRPEMEQVSGSTADLRKPAEGDTPRQVPTAQREPYNPNVGEPPFRGPAPAAAVEVEVPTKTHVSFKPQDPTDLKNYRLRRGEVRSLFQFEKALEEKASVLARIAEDAKVALVHAEKHAKLAQQYAEQAKSVKGGIGLVNKLVRLAEQAEGLRVRASLARTAALNSAESVKTLAANAQTRHGGIYRAVVDSPLTAPAERQFYIS
ncbi:hypothetical protein ACFWXO_05285 [Kitasatospora sp. NPDC059088]|uniref:hypothetical protein n=1 Tax=Kitasatospora sp. NPDC059088 TaxID=3346722 RepID=UPI003688D381